jgi:hypothetical protein
MNNRRHLVCIILLGGAAALGLYAVKTMQLRVANQALEMEIKRHRSAVPQDESIALLTAENAMRQQNLVELQQLQEQFHHYEAEIQRSLTGGDPLAQPEQQTFETAIQQEQERLQAEIAAIWEHTRAHYGGLDHLERIHAAAKRVREKGRPEQEDPAQVQAEYALLEQHFQEVAAAIEQTVEGWRLLADSVPLADFPPEIRAEFGEGNRRASEIWRDRLGPDHVLYEMGFGGEIISPATTPIIRSVMPDHRGVTVTVYLDGRVEFFKGEE